MIGHLLNLAVDVYRPAYAPDGAGGRTKVLSYVGAMRAKVSQASAAERMAAEARGAVLTHVVHMPAGAAVRRGDEIRVGGGVARLLRVRDVVSNSRGSYTRADCELIASE